MVSTGDNLAHLDAVPTALAAYEPLMDYPGVFVMGSNDYYGPIVKNPLSYFWPQSTVKILGAPLPWRVLRDGFVTAGWTDLNNQRTTMKVGGRTIEFVGTDDAHLGFDKYDDVQGVASRDADLNIGVTHAPYLRVIDRHERGRRSPSFLPGTPMVASSAYPALVRSSPTATSRPARPKDSIVTRQSWLHVSAGLGTSPYSPVRFACPPEATLLTLVPAA